MATVIGTLLFLVGEGPGRGEDASGPGGVLIVIGIALLVALTAAAALFLLPRVLRGRRSADRSSGESERPLPSEEGRPWSSER